MQWDTEMFLIGGWRDCLLVRGRGRGPTSTGPSTSETNIRSKEMRYVTPTQPAGQPTGDDSPMPFAVLFATAIFAAATAHAAYYKTLYCGAADGSGNPVLGARPGFFDFTDDCGTAYGDPAGTGGFLRLEENTTGTAGNTDEASYSWWPPAGTSIAAVSTYTRVPGYFNSGWRSRFWGEGYDGGEYNILMQGSGVPYEGINAPATSNLNYHAWPFGGYGDYKRLVFAMTCYRPAGCSRTGWNAADANSIAITLNDKEPAHVNWEGDSHVLAGDWVRANNTIAWRESDVGSGLRFSRFKVDGATLSDGTIDYQANGGCRTGHSDANGEFARDFTPCTQGPYLRYYPLRTEWFSDGQHQLSTCVQDFAQYQHLGESASESCDSRTIHTDNSAPGKPAALAIRSSNPARYLNHFGATFSLPPDPGSPIAKVHYRILNAANEVVVPEKTVSATDPTEVANIEGPAQAGAYHLQLWLEDSVGFVGQADEVAIPHDTTPPAAPQSLRVAGSDSHWLEKLDLRWQNIADNGSPIDTAHYELIDRSGEVVGSAHTLTGENVEALDGLAAPAQRGFYEARVWLSDEEGNTGAPASVPLPRDTTPPAAPQGLTVTPPTSSRSAEGFDVRWHDVADSGSPVDAVHYRVLDGGGKVVVATQTLTGSNLEAIGDLEAPRDPGADTLQLWLEDEEGNVGVPATAPLAYECVRSEGSGGNRLSVGLGERGEGDEVVPQGTGLTLHGRLSGDGGAVANASVCVFSRVVTDNAREFLGLAMTGPDGGYSFGIPAGASRELSVLYRSGHREVGARASIETVVHPELKVRRKVVRNKRFARFAGCIPGPDNANVIVVLQVRRGKGWLGESPAARRR